MKLSEFLVEIGKPVAYYPNLRHITKSVTATIFLCQFIYWIGKGKLDEGWIYKTSDEIEEETGLSYTEQKTAREKLIALDLLEERYARLDHQMLFRINTTTLDDLWGTYCGSIPESRVTELGNQGSLNSLISNTKNTAQNTASISKKIVEPEREPCDMDGITESMGLGYGGVRKKKVKPSKEPKHPAIEAYHTVTGRWPAAQLNSQIIEVLGSDPDVPFMRECFIEWLKISQNPSPYKWLFEWYKNGEIKKGFEKQSNVESNLEMIKKWAEENE